MSTRQCGWRMVLFDNDSATLSFGNIIKLYQPQHDGYLFGSSGMVTQKTKPDGFVKQQKAPYVKNSECVNLTNMTIH